MHVRMRVWSSFPCPFALASGVFKEKEMGLRAQGPAAPSLQVSEAVGGG